MTRLIPLRPRNVDDRIGGLAFAGAGTTPGFGVPMVLLSGKLAAQRIDADAAATRTPSAGDPADPGRPRSVSW